MAMSKTKKIVSLVLLGVLVSLGIGLYNLRAMGRAGYWEPTIREYEEADRIILPYRPHAVVLYAGVDDLVWGRTPGDVLSEFQHFVGLIHAALPETWIYFISIKPTRLFGTHWAAMKRTNALIEEFVHAQPKVEFIHVSAALLDDEGRARPELLSWDGLHPSRQGYELMTSIIKPVLVKRFLSK